MAARVLRVVGCGLAVFAVVLVTGGTAAGQVWLNETNQPAEADFANLQFPASIHIAAGESTGPVYGQLYELGATEAGGPAAGATAQLGYGPRNSDPRTAAGWQWVNAGFNTQAGNNDEFQGSLLVPTAGDYSYTFRYSFDGGASYTAGDRDGAGSNSGLTFDPATQLGSLTVTPEPGTLGFLAAIFARLALARPRRA